jgi:Uma2 family endonuclease
MSTFLNVKRSDEKNLSRAEDISAILARKFPDGLPVDDEYPCSDGAPVDNELQELVPGLLKAILIRIWKNRRNYLFAIDMGFYYGDGCIAPDAFLSLGVEHLPNGQKRSSYILKNELVVPILALEVVSKTYGGEYDEKFSMYQKIGVLYYVIYAPLMASGERLDVYKLVNGQYILQVRGAQPLWMPEIGLAIGRETLAHDQTDREWLFWYDQNGMRYLTPWEGEEHEAAKARAEAERADAGAAKAKAEAERADAEAAKARAETERADAEAAKAKAEAAKSKLLADRLRKLGVDPDLL